MKDISQNIDNIDIIKIDSKLLLEQFEEFMILKNYNSLIHFPNKDVNEFNQKKMTEL